MKINTIPFDLECRVTESKKEFIDEVYQAYKDTGGTPIKFDRPRKLELGVLLIDIEHQKGILVSILLKSVKTKLSDSDQILFKQIIDGDFKTVQSIFLQKWKDEEDLQEALDKNLGQIDENDFRIASDQEIYNI